MSRRVVRQMAATNASMSVGTNAKDKSSSVKFGAAGIHHKGIGSDTHHKGILQGGNKSMLSYNVGLAIPGYTGYIPSRSSIVAPPKGTTEHTGRVPPSDAGKKLLLDEFKQTGKTLYTTDTQYFRPQMKAESRLAGGLSTSTTAGSSGNGMDAAGADADALPKPKFTAVSTYKAEIQEADNTMKQALDRSHPLYGRSSVGYQTEYSSMILPGTHGVGKSSMSKSASVNFKMQRQQLQNSSPNLNDLIPRHAVLTRHAAPRFEGVSVYAKNFGKYGSNPMSRTGTVETARDMLKVATTLEFNGGSTKACDHLPAYGGFIPITHPNVRDLEERLPRQSNKQSMLLCSLDQYSRDTLPGCNGFRPQGIRNIRERGPPNTETIQGRANYAASRGSTQPVVKTNFRRSTEGVMSFYTPGQVSISDNGQALSERYFHNIRPLEGLPRIHHPSKTTSSGYAFTA